PEQPGGQYDTPADPRARKRPRSAERTIEQGQHEASKDDFFDQIGIARVEKDALKGKSLRGSTHGIVAQCDETDERQDADIDEGDGKRGGARFPGPADLPAELRAQKANEKQAPDEIERFALPVPFEFGKEADTRQREANEVDEKQQRDRKDSGDTVRACAPDCWSRDDQPERDDDGADKERVAKGHANRI